MCVGDERRGWTGWIQRVEFGHCPRFIERRNRFVEGRSIVKSYPMKYDFTITYDSEVHVSE